MNQFFSLLLPKKISTFAPKVDSNFWFIFWLSLFFFFVIQLTMLYFILKYRKNKRVYPRTDNLLVEILWTIVPLFLVIVIFVKGWVAFSAYRHIPQNAIEIKVTGKQWLWEFQYPDGTTQINKLVVPVNQPVKLVMTSRDVIHSLYIPAFRIKQDLLPNTYTSTWFKATKPGTYSLFCAEYCGTGHSQMLATVKVISEKEYEDFLASRQIVTKEANPVELGKRIYTEKGCNACHTIDGTKLVGPSFKGIFGKEVTLQNGTTVKVDENYIRESILEPQAKIVAGYPPIMPTFKGVLTDEEIEALIAFIKSLK